MRIQLDVDLKTRCMRWVGPPEQLEDARTLLASLPISPVQRSLEYRRCRDSQCVNPMHEQAVTS